MTKKQIILFFIVAGFLSGLTIWLLKKPVDRPIKTPAPILPHEPMTISPNIDVKNLTIDGKKVLGLRPGREKQDIQNVKITNSESPEWDDKLEMSIKEQGGDSVKSVEIRKVESLVLVQDDIALNVESAIVTVQNEKNEQTIFRVLVDSQTGKVLRNWDQPVRDPANPRENFGIKLDPRYHND